jgi:hypothetical protein
MRIIAALAVAFLLAACASFDGRGLVPGKSTAGDVEALMGTPADRVTRPNGDTLLYYSRLPEGRATYVATIGPDGVLRGIEQRLNYESIGKIVPHATTAKEVRELLGPPYRITSMDRLKRDVWEYPWRNAEDRRMLWVQVSGDGIVREVIEMHDFESDPPSGGDDSGKD